jgi:pyruvate dehydrogenase E2 component (dihydrolipoamide acetyltransferase)
VSPAPDERTTGDPKGKVRVEPMSAIRRRIAQHTTMSRAMAAHTLMAMEVDFSAASAARAAAAKVGKSLSYLPFVARAVAEAIVEFPRVNASIVDDALHVFPRLNLGIAVDLDFEGLIVPVVRDVASKTMGVIAAEIDDLATRARARRLAPNEVAHGTFTITNAGGYGTLLTGAIINQPQVAILSTDAIIPRPVAVARDDGAYDVAVRPVGVLALTWDHRAFDGAYAAAFLRRLKREIENRDWRAELTGRADP